jgi:tetratricopeptide (TPR) repeat protein
MKKYVLPLLALVAVLVGCNKRLDLAPEDTLIERDVFKTEAGSEQALAEAYYNLMQAATGSIAYVFGDFTTGNLQHSSFYDAYDKGEVNPTDEAVSSIWKNYFKAINSANNVIVNLPRYAKFAPDQQEQLVAEAKVIRALAYLDLLKFFGDGALTGNDEGLGLPLQLTPFEGYNTGDVIPRSNNGAVYTQVIKDLQESLPFLPDRHSNDLSTRSRATRGLANALLARTFLYRRDYVSAAAAAEAVLAKMPDLYDLTTDLSQLFPYNATGSAQTLTREYILAFPVSQMTSTSTNANNNLGNGYFFKRSFWINPAFISAFEAGDLRVTQLMFKGDSIYNPNMFAEKTTVKFNNSNGRDNVPLVRLAEVILTSAEALARTSGVTEEAVGRLNMVRSRSLPSAAPLTIADFTSSAQLLEAVLNQRRMELAFEGFYRYDLIRTNQPLLSPDIPENKKVLPVPQMEIDISKGVIQQNTGY